MKLLNRPQTCLLSLVVTSLISGQSPAAVLFTDTTNITVANTQVETGGDTSDNLDITGGLAGTLLSYTEIGLNTYSCCGEPFMSGNLNDGDIGGGVTSDGSYAIPDDAGAPIVLGFGSNVSLGSISIYNGYTNRDDGTYVLSDGSGNTLGGWTITTGEGASNDGADSFWLTFDTPVVTDRLSLAYSNSDISPSFREIQVFAPVPEPSGMALLSLTGCLLLVRRRRN